MAICPVKFRRLLRAALAVVIVVCAARSAISAKRARQYLKEPDGWFSTPAARQVAANILSYQSDLGGWPKNIDTTATAWPQRLTETEYPAWQKKWVARGKE